MSSDELRNHNALLFSRSNALVGADGRELRREYAGGTVVRLRPGVYADTDHWAELSEHDRHLLRIRAVAETRRAAPVFSHTSAALLWGHPVLTRDLRDVHAMAADGCRRSSKNGVAWHTGAVAPGDVDEIGGLLVTSRLRTVLDVARSNSTEASVILLDAELHRLSPWRDGERDLAAAAAGAIADLSDRLAELGTAPGTRRARSALGLSTHLAESPGESLSRVGMLKYGFPPPVLQYRVDDERGVIGYTDFAWPAFRLLGEFDGYAKYTRGRFTRGAGIEDIVWTEKQREDRMRARGWSMVRWLWADALDARSLAALLSGAGLPSTRPTATLSSHSDVFTRYAK